MSLYELASALEKYSNGEVGTVDIFGNIFYIKDFKAGIYANDKRPYCEKCSPIGYQSDCKCKNNKISILDLIKILRDDFKEEWFNRSKINIMFLPSDMDIRIDIIFSDNKYCRLSQECRRSVTTITLHRSILNMLRN